MAGTVLSFWLAVISLLATSYALGVTTDRMKLIGVLMSLSGVGLSLLWLMGEFLVLITRPMH